MNQYPAIAPSVSTGLLHIFASGYIAPGGAECRPAGGHFSTMPDPKDVQASLTDIEALLPEIRDWLAE